MKGNNCLPLVQKWTHQMLQPEVFFTVFLELNLKACSETKPFAFFTADFKLVTLYTGGISDRNRHPQTVLLMVAKLLAISYKGDGRKKGTS